MRVRGRLARLRELAARATLRDVVFATLPLYLLAGWLLAAPVVDYVRAKRFDDWWSHSAHVHSFAKARALDALQTFEYTRHERALDPGDPYSGALRLYTDRDDWARIASAPARHLDEWIEAELDASGEAVPAELRLRGDSSAHWTADKKSLTIKTGRNQLYRGYRRLALSLKDVLPQYTVGRLARDFDLLAPETAVLPLFRNNRFQGILRFVEPIDESFLRRHGQLPGNVYRADRAERGEYYKGLPRGVFKDPALWERVAKNDRPGSAGQLAWREFLRILNDTSDDRELDPALWKRLDRDELARVFALLLFAGDPYHMSAIHNQFWYEEPASGLLRPIVWDLRLLDLASYSEPLNPFWRAVLRDGSFFDQALVELRDRLDHGSALTNGTNGTNGTNSTERDGKRAERATPDLVERASTLAHEAWSRHEHAFEYDRLRRARVSDVGHPEQVARQCEQNAATLRSWFADGRAAVLCTPLLDQQGAVRDSGPEALALVVDIEVRGWASLELRGFSSEGGIDAVHRDTNQNGVLDAGDERLLGAPDSDTRPGFWCSPVALYQGLDTSGSGLRPSPVAYRFFLSGLDSGPDGASRSLPVEPVLANRLTGDPIETEPLRPGTRLAPGVRARHAGPGTTTRLSGNVTLTEDLLVAPGNTLVLEPGTTLSLAPDVSIVARGKLLAHGRPDAPVRIERADPRRPWGVVAVQGPASAGSRFAHTHFTGGGGALVDTIEYKGSVCAHWTRDLRFEQCEFADNVRCDDLFNAVQSCDVTLSGCRFRDANADAIDFDYTSGVIEQCAISGSGNDAIDLMSCSPFVLGCEIEGSGDKGISIGEDAAPLVYATRIRSCARGLEVKDASAPTILGSLIEDCELALLEHPKNWRYGDGGAARLLASTLRDNDVALDVDPSSRLTVHASSIGASPLQAARNGGAPPELDAPEGSQALLTVGLRDERVPERWRPLAPLATLGRLQFSEDLDAPTAGWSFEGEITRLVVRGRQLTAHARRGTGRIGRRVDWPQTSGESGGRRQLVVEYATQNLSALTLSLSESHPGSDLELTQPLPGVLGQQFALAILELDRAPIEQLVFELSPGDDSLEPGRFFLRSISLYESTARHE